MLPVFSNILKKNIVKVVSLGIFFKATTPTHDGKTIGDIEKRFFAFNCQLKKPNGEILI